MLTPPQHDLKIDNVQFTAMIEVLRRYLGGHGEHRTERTLALVIRRENSTLYIVVKK